MQQEEKQTLRMSSVTMRPELTNALKEPLDLVC